MTDFFTFLSLRTALLQTSLAKMLLVCGLVMLVGCSTNQLGGSADMMADRELAELALNSGRPESAITIYRKQLISQPNDTALLLSLGIAYNQLSEFDLALHYLNQAMHYLKLNQAESLLTDDPEMIRGQILREKGNAQQGLGKVEAAQFDLKQAAKLLPHDPKVLNSLGINYALVEDYSKAREAFTHALANAPEKLEYRNNLALAWILAGQPQQGIDVLYAHYLRGSSTPKSRQNLALAFAMKGDVEAAKIIAKQDLTKAELENNLAYYQQLKASQQRERPLQLNPFKQVIQ